MSPDALAQACAEALWRNDHASQGLGMALQSVGPGTAHLSMPVTQAMLNGLGTCHGGFIFTLADTAFAFACNTHGDQVVAQHCTIAFLQPVPRDAVLHAHAAERTRTGRSGVYDVTVRDAEGTVVAEFRGNSRTTGKRFDHA